MGNKKKILIEDVEPLIEAKSGNIAAMARALGVSRGTIWNRINESTNLVKALADARETMIDNVESTLYAQARNGNTTAMIFFLKTQGRGRGYQERMELTGKDGEPIELRWPDR